MDVGLYESQVNLYLFHLSSNMFRLSRNSGLVCLEHVPIALVASIGTISYLSSPYLCPVSKSLFSSSPGL